MVLFRLLVPISLISSALGGIWPLSSKDKSIKPFDYLHRKPDPKPYPEECLCPLNSGTSISDLLDYGHHGLERLVIFVYRNKRDGHITGFIPSGRYQKRIPDMPVEAGVLMRSFRKQSILDIFENSRGFVVGQDVDTGKYYTEDSEEHSMLPDNLEKITENESHLEFSYESSDDNNKKNKGKYSEDHSEHEKNKDNSDDGSQADSNKETEMSSNNESIDENKNEGTKEDTWATDSSNSWQIDSETGEDQTQEGSPEDPKKNNQDKHKDPTTDNSSYYDPTLDDETLESEIPNSSQQDSDTNEEANSNSDKDVYFDKNNASDYSPEILENDSSNISFESESHDNPKIPEKHPEISDDSVSKDNDSNNSYEKGFVKPKDSHEYVDEELFDSFNDSELGTIEFNDDWTHSVPGSIREYLSYKEKPVNQKWKKVRIPKKNKKGIILGWTTVRIPIHPIESNNDSKYWRWVYENSIPLEDDTYDTSGHILVNFNKWFNNQMIGVTNKHHKWPLKTQDIMTIKKSIQGILIINGLHLSKKGALTNTQGKILNLNNLKLRPLLIGSSVAYDRFITGDKEKYKIPNNAPFLEALLVTLKNPAKILGIVPLGITTLPKSLHKVTGGNKKIHVFEIQGKESESPRLLLTPINKDNKVSAHPLERETSVSQHIISKKEDASPSSAPSLVNLLNGDHIKKKIEENFQSPQEDQKNNLLIISGTSKESVSEEKPGFRIVGGKAATGSGTPITNRGRSGRIFAPKFSIF